MFEAQLVMSCNRRCLLATEDLISRRHVNKQQKYITTDRVVSLYRRHVLTTTSGFVVWITTSRPLCLQKQTMRRLMYRLSQKQSWPLYLSIYASMRPCIHASMHPCSHASTHSCIHASMHQCMDGCMHRCISSMHPCMHASMCLHMQSAIMHLCIHAFLDVLQYPCIHAFIYASMHPCIHAWIDQSIHLPFMGHRLCIHAYMHLCIYATMHPCMYASMHPGINASTQASI